MSDTIVGMDATTMLKASKNMASPNTAFEVPKFEMPKFEIPMALRELAENGGAQAKQNYEKMKTASKEMTGLAEATYATASEGAKDYGLKVIEITRANANAAFDFVGNLIIVKSLSEAVELSTAHAREQFDTIYAQHKELLALAQKVGTDTAEPIKTGMSKAYERNV